MVVDIMVIKLLLGEIKYLLPILSGKMQVVIMLEKFIVMI